MTPDGCPVDLYRLLPPGEAEAQIVAAVVPPGASLLELGAGSGRVTHCLLAQGYRVVAVDESPQMLASIHGCQTVLSAIEDLSLHRTFDAVILGSHLVNVPDSQSARALLAACRRHVAADGVVLIERRAPSWFDEVAEAEFVQGGIAYLLSDIRRHTSRVLTATVTYRVGHQEWSQTFTTRRLTDADLDELLLSCGLELVRFADDLATWAVCTPVHS